MEISHSSIISGKNNPWLVFIHGFGGTKNMWKHQIEQFREAYNLMIIELPGHGDSESGLCDEKKLSIHDVSKSVIEMLQRHNIEKADFICVSLGTLIMAGIMQINPDIVNKVLLCGAVFGMKGSSRVIMKIGNVLKMFFPYMTMIHVLASILMPRRTHKVSRKFLVSESRKLGRAEFLRWYSVLCNETNLLKNNLQTFKNANSLVVMGSEDHVFLKKAVVNVLDTANNFKLDIMENCGHVCSLEKWREFNAIAADFFLPKVKQTVTN